MDMVRWDSVSSASLGTKWSTAGGGTSKSCGQRASARHSQNTLTIHLCVPGLSSIHLSSTSGSRTYDRRSTCELGWPATTGILMYKHGFCYGQAVLTQNQFALRVPTREQTPQMTEPLGPHKPLHADDTWREVHHLTENKKLNQLQWLSVLETQG